MSTELRQIVNTKNSALVVWDVQESLVSSIFNREQFLQKVVELIQGARKHGVPIFYSKITPLPEKYQNRAMLALRRGAFNPGEIVNDVRPVEGDVVINKNTASFFVGTNFELMTRNAGINVLVFTGIATNFGVETSARHAQCLGYLPVIAKEAVSSSNKEAHERSLENMKLMFPVLSNKEILELWM
jgi:nicotinamidase-related amidase